jgi:hypothetical protein
MASKESELIVNGGSTYNGGTGLVFGKNLSKPCFRALSPPLKDIFTDAGKVSGLKSGQRKVAYLLVAGKHVACVFSTKTVQLDPTPFGRKFSPNTVTVNPGTLITGVTDVTTGGCNKVKDSLIDAGVLWTIPEKN